jgi:hypothetical protein
MTSTSPDPLQRIRHELVAAAARANRRRRRKQRILLFAVLPLVLLTASAGAAAVGGFTTGVAPVDRLLETEGQADDGTDPRPGPVSASEPLRLPDAADGTGAAEVAYLSRDGRVCKAQADFRRSDNAPRGTSGGGCYSPRDLARTLSRKKAICCGSSNGPDRRIYDGFAAGEVVALRFYMEDGATFDARLTPEWTPDVPGGEPLRIFVAVDERDIDVGADGVQPDELDLLHQRYRVEGELRDGRTVQIRTPWSGWAGRATPGP